MADTETHLIEALSTNPYGLSQMTKDDMARCWRAIGEFIRENMLNGKGVTVPELGTFSFTSVKVDLGNRFKVVTAPAFFLSEHFSRTHGVRSKKPNPTGSIPVVSLNFFAVAESAGVSRGEATGFLKDMLVAIADYVHMRKAVEVSVGVGRLLFSGGSATLKWNASLINELEKGNSLVSESSAPLTASGAVANRGGSSGGRPSTSGALRSGRRPNTAGVSGRRSVGDEAWASEAPQRSVLPPGGAAPSSRPPSRVGGPRPLLGGTAPSASLAATAPAVAFSDVTRARPASAGGGGARPPHPPSSSAPSSSSSSSSSLLAPPRQSSASGGGGGGGGGGQAGRRSASPDPEEDSCCSSQDRAENLRIENTRKLLKAREKEMDEKLKEYAAADALLAQQQERDHLTARFNKAKEIQDYNRSIMADRERQKAFDREVSSFASETPVLGGRPLTPPPAIRAQAYSALLGDQVRTREARKQAAIEDEIAYAAVTQAMLDRELEEEKQRAREDKARKIREAAETLEAQIRMRDELRAEAAAAAVQTEWDPTIKRADGTRAQVLSKKEATKKMHEDQLAFLREKKAAEDAQRRRDTAHDLAEINRVKQEAADALRADQRKATDTRLDLEAAWADQLRLKQALAALDASRGPERTSVALACEADDYEYKRKCLKSRNKARPVSASPASALAASRRGIRSHNIPGF